MPSKTKSKKTQKKSAYTACWMQNDDGTLSLTVGSKNSSSNIETTPILNSPIDNVESEMTPPEYNVNVTQNDNLKSPQTAAVIDLPNNPSSPNSLPMQILKPNRPNNGINYHQHLQSKRRLEMSSEYDFQSFDY